MSSHLRGSLLLSWLLPDFPFWLRRISRVVNVLSRSSNNEENNAKDLFLIAFSIKKKLILLHSRKHFDSTNLFPLGLLLFSFPNDLDRTRQTPVLFSNVLRNPVGSKKTVDVERIQTRERRSAVYSCLAKKEIVGLCASIDRPIVRVDRLRWSDEDWFRAWVRIDQLLSFLRTLCLLIQTHTLT